MMIVVAISGVVKEASFAYSYTYPLERIIKEEKIHLSNWQLKELVFILVDQDVFVDIT